MPSLKGKTMLRKKMIRIAAHNLSLLLLLRPIYVLFTPLDAVCSVSFNDFKSEGAKYFSDMLRVNTTLQSVE